MNQAIVDFSKVTSDHTAYTIKIAESILTDCSIDVRALEIIVRQDQFSVVDRFRGAKVEYVDIHAMNNPEVVTVIVRQRLERFAIERRSGVIAVISYHKPVLLTAGEFRSTGLNLRIGSFRTFDRPRESWSGFKDTHLGHQQPYNKVPPAEFHVIENHWQSRFGGRFPNLKTVIDLLVGGLKESPQSHHTRAQLREILVRQDEKYRKQWGEQPGMISMIVQGAESSEKIDVFSPNPGRPEFDKIRLRSEQINPNVQPSHAILPKDPVHPESTPVADNSSHGTSLDTSPPEIATTTATELSRRYQRIVAASGRGPYSRIRHSFYKVVEENFADLANLPVNQFVRRAIDKLEAESEKNPMDAVNGASSEVLEKSTRSFNWRTLGDAMIRILLDSKALSDEAGNAIEYSLKGRTTIVKQLTEHWRDKADAIILLTVIREEPVSDLNFVDLGGLLFHSRNEDQFESRLLKLLQILLETNQIVEEYQGQVRIYKIKSAQSPIQNDASQL